MRRRSSTPTAWRSFRISAAFGARTPADLDPADRTDLYLEIARSMAARYADVVDAVNSLEAYERNAQS